MNTTERMDHAKEKADRWSAIWRTEYQLNHSHPGALDALYSGFHDWTVVEDATDDTDMVELFHDTITFTSEKGVLTAEFPYDSITWDPDNKRWLAEDGTPFDPNR